MKKLILPIILAAVVGLVPYIDGQLVHRMLTDHLARANAELKSRNFPGQLSLEDYHAGWAQSRALYRLTFTGSGQAKTPACLAAPARVHHGWGQILAGHWMTLNTGLEDRADCDGLKRLQATPALDTLAQALKGLKIEARLGLAGATTIAFSSPAVQQGGKKGVHFGALSGRFAVDRDGRQVDYHLHWDGLKLPLEQTLRSAMLRQSALGGIGEVSLKGRQRRYLRHLNTGTVTAKIAGLSYVMAANGRATRIQVQGLQIGAQTHAQSGQLDSDASLEVAGVKLDDVDFGALKVNASFQGMQAAPWDRFSEQVVQMRRKHPVRGTQSPAQFLAALPAQAIRDAIDGLKDASLKLNNAAYQLGNNQVRLTGSVRWPGVESLKPAVVQAQPAILLQAVDAVGKARMDAGFPQTLAHRSAQVMGQQSNMPKTQREALEASLSQRFGQFLERLARRGVVVPDKNDSGYRLQATLRHGQPMLNGHPWGHPVN